MGKNNHGPLAEQVSFFRSRLNVTLEDGRTIGVPLNWFPRLRKASKEELEDFRFIGDGAGIHWNALDVDIDVMKLFDIEVNYSMERTKKP